VNCAVPSTACAACALRVTGFPSLACAPSTPPLADVWLVLVCVPATPPLAGDEVDGCDDCTPACACDCDELELEVEPELELCGLTEPLVVAAVQAPACLFFSACTST
jgi:hypothetical protein